MSFVRKDMVKNGSSLTSVAPMNWAFGSTTDALATITASAYFDGMTNEFTLGDMIVVKDSANESDLLQVTSAKGVTPVTVSGFVSAGSVADGSLDGGKAAVVVSNQTASGILRSYDVLTAGGATADTDVVVDDSIKVKYVIVQNLAIGTVSDTITIKNGSSAIIDISGADNTVSLVSTIDDANASIAAAGTLRVTETDGGGSDSPSVLVTVVGTGV